MTHHDARRIASEAGFRVVVASPTILCAKRDDRDVDLVLLSEDDKLWRGYMEPWGAIIRPTTDEQTLHEAITRELETRPRT